MKKSDDVVIRVDSVKKYFKVYPDKGKTLKEKVLFLKRNRYELREVLKGISFEVKRGEAIGLIGKNGCGKSTTLKLLTRILRPNEGTITIEGRVSSLIELGAGFHPDLTGRENIYINASIFGIKAKEVKERMDDIIRFSELEEYIDNPVRTYSSGMYMRLAFSVAINVDADILLIDEILAVGDMNFQEKCFHKLQEIKRNGTTIIIVSHSQDQIKKICDRAIWIDEGLIREEGVAKLICREYELCMNGRRADRAKKEAEAELQKLKKEAEAAKENEELQKRLKRERDLMNLSCRDICRLCSPAAHREGNWKIKYTNVRLVNSQGLETEEICFGEPIKIEMEYVSIQEGLLANFIVGITRDDWVYCFGSTSEIVNKGYSKVNKKGKVTFKIDSCSLAEGRYYVDVRIKDENDEVYDNVFSLMEIRVKTEMKYGWGIVSMQNQWLIDNESIKGD